MLSLVPAHSKRSVSVKCLLLGWKGYFFPLFVFRQQNTNTARSLGDGSDLQNSSQCVDLAEIWPCCLLECEICQLQV